FPRVAMRLCAQCGLIDENRFALVREYLLENDGAPVMEIASATGVPGSDVRAFMEGGRLIEVVENIDEICTCDGIGQRCRYCRNQLAHSFKNMQQEMTKEQREREAEEAWKRRTNRYIDDPEPRKRAHYV